MSVVTLLTGWFMSGYITKWTFGKYTYNENFLEPSEKIESASELKRSKRAAIVFIGTIIVMAILGIILKQVLVLQLL